MPMGEYCRRELKAQDKSGRPTKLVRSLAAGTPTDGLAMGPEGLRSNIVQALPLGACKGPGGGEGDYVHMKKEGNWGGGIGENRGGGY